MRVEFKRLPHGEGLPLPAYATDGAAGMDVCAAEDTVLPGRQQTLVKTGFAVAVMEGYEMQVRPRSGLALKNGLTIPNTPGTVDSDYRGELCIIMHNLRDTAYYVKKGDRIAQLVVAPVIQASVEEVDELDETVRGAGGFGSTGKR